MSGDFENHVQSLVQRLTYKPQYRLLLERDQTNNDGRVYLQVECRRPDAKTGEMGLGRGGKAYLSEHMTDSELVRLAFGLFLKYEEHECREWFRFDDRAVFGPHIDVRALFEAAERLEKRG